MMFNLWIDTMPVFFAQLFLLPEPLQRIVNLVSRLFAGSRGLVIVLAIIGGLAISVGMFNFAKVAWTKYHNVVLYFFAGLYWPTTAYIMYDLPFSEQDPYNGALFIYSATILGIVLLYVLSSIISGKNENGAMRFMLYIFAGLAIWFSHVILLAKFGIDMIGTIKDFVYTILLWMLYYLGA